MSDSKDWQVDFTIVPGPRPNYPPTLDPEPWLRPFSGERAPDTGINLHGSGYVWRPRIEYDLPPAYNGCHCSCHVWPGVSHVAPCCSPGQVSEFEDIIVS